MWAILPDLKSIFDCSPVATSCPVVRIPGATSFNSLADIISGLLNIVILISAFLTFFWLVWGAFQYITAGGDKNALAQARSRIIWAIVGLFVVLIAFVTAQWAAQILPPFLTNPTKQPTPTI